MKKDDRDAESRSVLRQQKTWLWEFTKKIVWIVTVLFVVTYIFSEILLIFHPDSIAISAVIENVSDVFKVTVVSYAVKAGLENIFKIRRNNNELDSEQLGISFDCPGSDNRCN